MRKRLLMQLLAVFCVMGAYATEIGEYVYTTAAKFKVTAESIFANGDFKANYEGWTNEQGGAPSGIWTLVNGGPTGSEIAIVSGKASTESGDSLVYVTPITPGNYAFSYWVKADASLTTSVAAGANNYVNFFFNTNGNVNGTSAEADGYVGYAMGASYGTTWKQVVANFTVENEGFFVLSINNVATNTMFTNFELFKVVSVYDTRIAERKLAYMKKLYNEELLTDKGDLGAYIQYIEGALAGENGDIEEDASWYFLEDEVDPAIDYFLSTNAGNLCSTTEEGVKIERYLYDWGNWGYSQWNSYNNSTRNGWTTIGSRWGFAPNVAANTYTDSGAEQHYLERPWDDGPVYSAGIQRGNDYTLDVGMKVADDALAGLSLQPGFYMFSIEAQAVAAQYSSNSDISAYGYGSNPGVEIAGPWMWVGSDTLAFKTYNETDALDHPTWKFSDETTVLNGTNWQRLYVIGEVKEGENISGGIHFPVVASTGGRYSLRYPEFRLIGKTQEEVDQLYAFDYIQIHRNTLKERLDLAAEDNAKTKADGYPWGHDVLTDSITKHTAFYDETFKWIDAEGKIVDESNVTLAKKDTTYNHMVFMGNARTNFANTNKVYQNLVADIATCNDILNDAAYAAADHPTFEAVIKKAQAMVDATGADAQIDLFNDMDFELMTANEAFRMATGSYLTPIDLTYTLKNGGFEDWGTSEPNYTSNRTIYNWELTCGADIKQWQVRNNTAYDSGKSLGAWRGTTVGPNGTARQVVTLTRPGVYEYRAKAFATDDTWAQYVTKGDVLQNVTDLIMMTTEAINDTIWRPNIRLWFGVEGTVSPSDSIVLYKVAPQLDSIGYTRYTPLEYSVILVKEGSEEKTYELGFQARDNGATSGANAWGFGDNHLFYLGDSESACSAALTTAFNEACTEARDVIAKYKDATFKISDEKCRLGIINSMYRYMGDKANHPVDDKNKITVPTTLQEKQNSILSLKECIKLLDTMAAYDPETAGIKQVNADGLMPVVGGVYSLTGRKVAGSISELNSLPKGIYIVNGKKYLVK